jgi:hypothetical protein
VARVRPDVPTGSEGSLLMATRNFYTNHQHTSEGYEACEECKEAVRINRINNNHHAISNMERALKTYRDRNRVYGNNYKRFGVIMHALYPDGVTINDAHQWNRFGIILQKISKLSRYVTDPMHGHIDSIHDDGVYSFMLEELDAEDLNFDVSPPAPLVTTVKPTAKDILPNPCEHIYNKNDPKCVSCGEVKA